jgi:hypothetical protein
VNSVESILRPIASPPFSQDSGFYSRSLNKARTGWKSFNGGESRSREDEDLVFR